MKKFYPLKEFVTSITNEANPEDEAEISRAVRSWYNRKGSGSVPGYIFTKLGGKLFIDYSAFLTYLEEQKIPKPKIGRPRSAL
jgi:hypothetical protein